MVFQIGTTIENEVGKVAPQTTQVMPGVGSSHRLVFSPQHKCILVTADGETWSEKTSLRNTKGRGVKRTFRSSHLLEKQKRRRK
jgi:hypothetical protein